MMYVVELANKLELKLVFQFYSIKRGESQNVISSLRISVSQGNMPSSK
jgi:hypothetical protein